MDLRGVRVTRCWNPIHYRGRLGEELCEEHARLLVAEHGLPSLTPEDRSRFAESAPGPVAGWRIRLHLPRPSSPAPTPLTQADADELIDRYARQGHVVLVKSPGQARPEILDAGRPLGGDVSEAWVLPPPATRAERDQIRRDASRQRRRARELRLRSVATRDRVARLAAAVRRVLRVSVQVLDARQIHALTLGPEDAARLMDLHMRMGYHAVVQTRDGRRPIGAVPILPPTVSEVWMLPPESVPALSA
jgi:hypothetical protein